MRVSWLSVEAGVYVEFRCPEGQVSCVEPCGVLAKVLKWCVGVIILSTVLGLVLFSITAVNFDFSVKFQLTSTVAI